MGGLFLWYSIVTTINYKRLRLDGIEKTVEFETEKVNRTIGIIERGAISLSRSGLLYFKSQSSEISEISVLEYLRSFPTVTGCGFWFEPYAYNKDTRRAGIYGFYDKAMGELRLDDFDMAGYDYHNENWYREIIDYIQEPYQVAWTKPYMGEISLALVTTAGAGIFDDAGRLIGVSNIDWEVDQMTNEFLSIKPTENSFVVMCSPEHSLIISSAFAAQDEKEILNSIHEELHSGSFTLNGIKYLSFSRNLDNGWLLSVPIPEKEIFAEVESQNARFSLIIVSSAFLMLCLVYLIISRLVNAPIAQLTSDVARLALGNLDSEIKITSKDELGLLGQTFNKMKTDLKNSIEAFAKEHIEKERLSTEINIASEIQARMLPHVFPPFPDRTEFDIYALMLPAKEVGGDFYDFFLIDNDTLAVVIADVSGKGVPSALLMAITKTLIKNYASAGHGPEEVFNTVNNILCENNDSMMFVTAFLGYYNIANGRFVYVNAGHNPPLIKKGECCFEYIKTIPRFVLGVMKNIEYYEEEISLEPGDSLYLYTDGVTEAMNTMREFFTEQGLLEALNKNRDYEPRELLGAVKMQMDSFAGEAEQADDITMLALQVSHGASPGNKKSLIKELIVEANTENIDEVINFVDANLADTCCTPEMRTQTILAAEEIFSNIAKYAYDQPDYIMGDRKCYITIRIIAGAGVQLKFEDTGKPFNPLEQPMPSLDGAIEDRQIGGLGIFLVKKLMDKVEYARSGNKNIIVLSKRIEPELGQLEEVF